MQGRFAEASEFAERAVEAAKRCQCSPYNLTRARLVALKSELERAHFAPERASGLTSQLEILQEDCAKLRHRRCVAEVKLLRIQLRRSDEYQRRRELVSEAFEELAERESELRGTAEGELGRVFLQSNQLQLAKFYLQNGVEVSERLLREVDRAHLAGDLATLEGMQGEVRAQVDTLLNVITDAEKSGMLPLVLQKRLELIKVLQTAGYNQAALEQIDSTVSVFERLRAANPKGASEEAHFEREQLLLAEQRLALAISLTREAEVP